jgi:hypothetical protein
MSAASAPTPPTYDVCTPTRWDDWYKAIGVLGEGGTDFGLLETVGQELQTMKVPFAEGWGDTLNDLQMGRLCNKLRLANVWVDDLVVDPGAFKHKKREWWFTQGASYCDRLAAKFWAPKWDVLSKEMMDSTSLSPSECTAVVEDPLFEQWEAHLVAEDYKKAAALSSTQTKFGKSVTHGWIFFQEHAGSASAAKSAKLNPGDTHQPWLDAALLKMTQVWERHVQGTLKSSYPNRCTFPPTFHQFHALLHAQLSGWNDKTQFGEKVVEAIAMLAGKTDKTVTWCGAYELAKATRAVLKLLHQLIPQVGKHAKVLAVDLLEIWADADLHFVRYAEYYGATAEGQEPYHLLRKFLLLVLDEWAETMWGELCTDRAYHPVVLSLSDMLQREYMRQRPDWGLSTLIERATSLPEQAAGGSHKRKGAPQAEPESALGAAGGGAQKDPSSCAYCGKAGHKSKNCRKRRNDLRSQAAGGAGHPGVGDLTSAAATAFLSKILRSPEAAGSAPPSTTLAQAAATAAASAAAKPSTDTPGAAGAAGSGQQPPLPAGRPGGQGSRRQHVPPEDRICFACGQKGHEQWNCPRKR